MTASKNDDYVCFSFFYGTLCWPIKKAFKKKDKHHFHIFYENHYFFKAYILYSVQGAHCVKNVDEYVESTRVILRDLKLLSCIIFITS